MNELKSVIKNYIESNYNCKLIDISEKGDNRNRIYEVFVDGREYPGIDELALINKGLWKHVEENILSKGILKISVSTPGVERSFKFLFQLIKHVGRVLEIKSENGEIYSGKLVKIDEESGEIYLIIRESKTVEREEIFKFDKIIESKVKLHFK